MRREFHVRFCESPRVQFPRATRLVLCFELAEDAQTVSVRLRERFAKFGLALHPKKTRSFRFQPPDHGGGNESSNFDFLGFTVHWQKARTGRWRVAWRTRNARLRRAIDAAVEWCRGHRHLPVEGQRAALARKLNGHYNYFGVNGNVDGLARLHHAVKRAWRKWLNRRSQRARMTWERFEQLLVKHPLPKPEVRVRIWGKP